METDEKKEQKSGILLGLAAFMLWGVLPVYWKSLSSFAAEEILAHRVVWSFVFMAVVLLATGQLKSFWTEVRQIAGHRKRVLGICAASLMISINWLVFIWAVNANRIVETSLGFYINPLVSVLLGVLVLKERLSFWQTAAFSLAGAGVLVLTLQFGTVPWVSLLLAGSFAVYGLCKKMVNISAVTSITLETLLISPWALLYLVYLEQSGSGSVAFSELKTMLLFVGTGVVTATPLLLFSGSANRLPLTMIGFLQYLSPTIALLIGIMVYHEPFSGTHAVAFGCIWGALVLVSMAQTKAFMKMEAKLTKKAALES